MKNNFILLMQKRVATGSIGPSTLRIIFEIIAVKSKPALMDSNL